MNQSNPNTIKILILMSAFGGLFCYYGNKLAGLNGIIVAVIVVLIVCILAYFNSDKFVLSLYQAKIATTQEFPLVYSMTAYLSEKAEIPMPIIYVIDNAYPNCFSTGRNITHAAVVVTKGMVNLLNKEELAGVIAHEIAHIQQGDTLLSTVTASIGWGINVIAAFVKGTYDFILARRRVPEESNRVASFLLSLLGPFIALIIQFTISRKREYLADEKAAQLCANPRALANALRKIDNAHQYYQLEEAEKNPITAHVFIFNPLLGRKWGNMFQTHPPIDDRILRLDLMA